MRKKTRDLGGGVEWTPNDDKHLKELSNHINDFLHLLEDYRDQKSTPQAVAKAYDKICKDAKSSNRIERELARAVLDKFSQFHLKVQTEGHPHTAHSFLQDYITGKIRDESSICLGMEGLCSNFGLMMLKLCKTDAVEDIIREQKKTHPPKR